MRAFIQFLNLTILFISATAMASNDKWQLRGSGGITQMSAGETHLIIPGVETSTINFDDEDAAIVSAGIGYVYPLNCDDDCDDAFYWFPRVTAGIDGTYQFMKEFSPEISLDNTSTEDHADAMEVQSATAMFNLTLDVFKLQRLSLFAIGGAGVAWTWTEWHHAAGIDLNLENEESDSFAFQFGGGLGFELIPTLDLTLTYLYTDLGNTQLINNAEENNSDIDVDAAEIYFRQQSILLGLQWDLF